MSNVSKLNDLSGIAKIDFENQAGWKTVKETAGGNDAQEAIQLSIPHTQEKLEIRRKFVPGANTYWYEVGMIGDAANSGMGQMPRSAISREILDVMKSHTRNAKNKDFGELQRWSQGVHEAIRAIERKHEGKGGDQKAFRQSEVGIGASLGPRNPEEFIDKVRAVMGSVEPADSKLNALRLALKSLDESQGRT